MPRLKSPTIAAPSEIVLNLYAPGMTTLHRAGLGGLACTLRALQRDHAAGILPTSRLPAPFVEMEPPWLLEEHSITLKFGKPEKAGEYLKRLFEYAFQIAEGLIYLPGQYGDLAPGAEVLAAIQNGIQNTFLQHGPSCGSRVGTRTVAISMEGLPYSYTHDVFTSYKHQGWFWLDREEKSNDVDLSTGKKSKTGKQMQVLQDFRAIRSDGTLSSEHHEIENKLAPGATVRHEKFRQSAIRESSDRLICLHFALVGCLTLNVNPVTGVLVIPEVQHLLDFAKLRWHMTPTTLRECQVASAADAVLQAQARLRSGGAATAHPLSSFTAQTCRPTPWNKKQKPRVAILTVERISEGQMAKFQQAITALPPRLFQRRTEGAADPTPKSPPPSQAFWVDSLMRPLIAENLALGRPWYFGFVHLMTKRNPSTGELFRNQLSYERKGLTALVANPQVWDSEREPTIVKAMHEALRLRYRRIATQNQAHRGAMERGWEREYEQWRIALSAAKTPEHFRKAIGDLFNQGGSNQTLQRVWLRFVEYFRTERWQPLRDLALLALFTYPRQDKTQAEAE